MTTLEDIIRIATNAHDGQKDMIGNPAIQHVLTVGLMGQNELEQKADFLHDVVEDTDYTIEDLRRQDDALFQEILRFAQVHGWAEQYIEEAITPRPVCIA